MSNSYRDVNSIQRWSAIFHPTCLVLAGILAAAVGVAVIYARSTLPVVSGPGPLLSLFVAPTAYGVTLLVLMARFFASCRKDGIFSPRSISSIRWIGGILLVVSVIRLGLSFVYLTSDVAVLFPPHALSNITTAIIGIFLLMLSKIIAAANRLDGEAKFTI